MPKAPEVRLSERERAELERLVRGRRTGQHVAHRARVILLAAAGRTNTAISQEVGVNFDTASDWRRRWVSFSGVPLEEVSVAARLADAPRSGAPARLTAEQLCQIVALACEPPEAAGRPISEWSHRELAEEIVRRGITDRLSPRHAGRLLHAARSAAPSQSVLAEPTPHRRSG